MNDTSTAKTGLQSEAGAAMKQNRTAEGTVGEVYVDDPRMTCRNVDVYYGEKQAIFDVSLDVGKNQVIS
ncbi:MAG: phosphate ABC transporter ATP-binding protein, partial [Candidatus Thiodiazotropha taylori]